MLSSPLINMSNICQKQHSKDSHQLPTSTVSVRQLQHILRLWWGSSQLASVIQTRNMLPASDNTEDESSVQTFYTHFSVIPDDLDLWQLFTSSKSSIIAHLNCRHFNFMCFKLVYINQSHEKTKGKSLKMCYFIIRNVNRKLFFATLPNNSI